MLCFDGFLCYHEARDAREPRMADVMLGGLGLIWPGIMDLILLSWS